MLQSPAWELGQLVRVAECLYRGQHCEYLPPCYRSSCTQNYTPRSASTTCLLSTISTHRVYYLLYLHTVSTVYYLYYIYTPCLLSTYLLFTPQHRAGHLHGHRPRAHLHHSQRANILLLLCQRFCVLLRNIWCLPVFPKTILILICICIRSYHLCK